MTIKTYATEDGQRVCIPDREEHDDTIIDELVAALEAALKTIYTGYAMGRLRKYDAEDSMAKARVALARTRVEREGRT